MKTKSYKGYILLRVDILRSTKKLLAKLEKKSLRK
jgi:hypothetical protein